MATLASAPILLAATVLFSDIPSAVALSAGSVLSAMCLVYLIHRDLHLIALVFVWLLGVSLRILPSIATASLFGDTDGVYTYSAFTTFFSSGQFDTDALTPTHGFPGMFFMYEAVRGLTGLSHLAIAVWIHPLVNSLAILAVYVAARSIFVSPTLAVLAAFMYGTDFVGVRLGAEFRQEAIGIVLYVFLLYLLAATSRARVQLGAARIIVLATLVLSHLVSSANALVLLVVSFSIGLIVARSASRRGAAAGVANTRTREEAISTLNLSVLGLILIVTAVLFLASSSSEGLIVTASHLAQSVFASEPTLRISAEVSYGHYGPLVGLAAWLHRAALIGTSLYLFVTGAKRRCTFTIVIAVLCGLYSLLAVASTVFPLGLSSFRFYHVLIIPGSICLAYALSRVGAQYRVNRIGLALILAASLQSTLLRFPSYLIPGVDVLRPPASVDDSSYSFRPQEFELADHVANRAPVASCVLSPTRHTALAVGGLARHQNAYTFDEQIVADRCTHEIVVMANHIRTEQGQLVSVDTD